jgi:hypothetical protein
MFDCCTLQLSAVSVRLRMATGSHEALGNSLRNQGSRGMRDSFLSRQAMSFQSLARSIGSNSVIASRTAEPGAGNWKPNAKRKRKSKE